MTSYPPSTAEIHHAMRELTKALDRTTHALDRNTHKQGELMSSFADAQTSVSALLTDLQALVSASDALIAFLKSQPPAPAQADLDKLVSDVEAARATVAGETALEQAAVQPTPPPAP